MQHTRIKFCGITRAEDLHYAVELGVSALGFVFCANSPRNLSVDIAQNLLASCPPFIARVGLFMNQEASTIKSTLAELAAANVGLDILQFHGEESESLCQSFGLPYVKSIAMSSEQSLAKITSYPSAAALLLDSNFIGQPGGSGKVFDWERIPKEITQPIILAGGLDENNVAEAVRVTKPYAVDVSSGIEIKKGVKDPEKMKKFIQAVQTTNES